MNRNGVVGLIWTVAGILLIILLCGLIWNFVLFPSARAAEAVDRDPDPGWSLTWRCLFARLGSANEVKLPDGSYWACDTRERVTDPTGKTDGEPGKDGKTGIDSELDLPEAVDEIEQGNWTVTFFDGATEQMNGWFSRLRDPRPSLWPRYPNVDNAEANFDASDGLEYGLDESVFMEQNEFGRFPVQARGYRLISGDYNIPGIDRCEAESAEAGCAIAIFNVGEVTADLEAWVRQGFTTTGRYWNGDTLEVAMWALSSHVSANMLNMATFGAGEDTLNQPDRTNAGANCSVPDACDRVRFTITITSGNQLLVRAVTFVSR